MVEAVDPHILTKTKIHTRTGRAAGLRLGRGGGRGAPRAARAGGARETLSRGLPLITYIRVLHMTHEDMTS